MDIEIASVVVSPGRRALRDVRQLAESVREIGLLNPITVTPDRRLVAGYHRLEACRSLGWAAIPAVVVQLDALHAELAEIDENLVRNELTVLERSEQLARRKQVYEALHPAARHGAQGGGRGGKGTRARTENDVVSFSVDTASKTNTSARSVQRDVQIAAGLPDDVRDQLRGTAVADSKTDLLKLSRMEPEDQRKAAAKIASGEAKNLKLAKRAVQREAKQSAPTPAIADRHRLLRGDLATAAAAIEDGSVDVIITDPPYPREYLPVYESLAKVAARVLKPGGACLVMVGQSYLPEILAAMAPHLRYHWTLAYLTPGGQAVQVWPRKVNTFWKPLLWFVNGEHAGDWIGDVTKSAPNDNDKRFHHWGQSESGMADVVGRFSYPDQVVLDPFCGGGTTGVVAAAMGRRFIGIDVSDDALAATARRLAEVA